MGLLFVDSSQIESALKSLAAIALHIESIAMDQTQQTAALEATAESLTNIGNLLSEGLGEITAEIAALKDQVAAGGASTPAMDAAFESIASKLTAVSATASQLANVSPPVA